MLLWPAMTSYDLYGVTNQNLHLIHCWIAFESSRMAGFIMDVKKHVERLTTGNFCINWVVTWPSEQGHSSTIKGNRNLPLADIVLRGWKVSCGKKTDLCHKTVACNQENKTVWRGGCIVHAPRSGRELNNKNLKSLKPGTPTFTETMAFQKSLDIPESELCIRFPRGLQTGVGPFHKKNDYSQIGLIWGSTQQVAHDAWWVKISCCVTAHAF